MIYLLDSGVSVNTNYCIDRFDLKNLPDDEVGHGTSMASVIKNVSPNSQITSIKIGNDKPTLKDVLSCLEYVSSKAVEGYKVLLFNANFLNQKETKILELKLESMKEDFVILVPAGNNSSSVDLYTPAHCNYVWTVGSLNKNKKITSVSNVDGNKIIDFWVVSTNVPAINKEKQSVRLFGTSVAASIAAALADKYQITNKNVLNNLIEEYNGSVAFN